MEEARKVSDEVAPSLGPGHVEGLEEVARTTDATSKESEEIVWYRDHASFLGRHPFLCGYTFLGLLVALIFATHLRTFALSFLFLYLISDFLTNDIRKIFRWIPKALLFSIMYLAIVAAVIVLTYKIIPNFVKHLPTYANQIDTEVIKNIEYLTSRYDLSEYVDPKAVRSAVLSWTSGIIGFLAGKFGRFYQGFIYFIFALVINLLLYHSVEKIDRVFKQRPGSLMSFLYVFAMQRVRLFYFYFKRVMGGQFVISAINASLTLAMVIVLKLPHKVALVLVVYLFGLLPIVGNLVSNAILTLVALTSVGLWGAAVCLCFLIAIHKLEYFLNSKIIGDIIKLPMVVTLTALIASQVLLGITGMILALPLVLYVRHELELIPGLPAPPDTPS